MRGVWGLVFLAFSSACGGSVAHTETTKRPAQAPPSQSGPVSAQSAPSHPTEAAAAQPAGATPEPSDAGAAGHDPDAQAAVRVGAPGHVEAGEISRAALLAVLSQGAGRFLQKVRAEPHLVSGRFMGWRIVSVFGSEAKAQGAGLQPGDTVMRVNGQSIERPEQFKNVWDSMATQSELVLLVQRDGKRSQLRYRIVEPE